VGGLGYLAARQTFGQAQALSAAVSDQQTGLQQDLAQIATTTGDAAASAHGFAASLDQAQQSLATAAQAANGLAASFEQASALAQVQIFGVRPFGQLGASLGQSSAQFRTLAAQLQATADSFSANRDEVRRLGADLQEIQRRIDQLSRAVEASGAGTTTQSIRGLELAVSWLLIWLALQSLAWLLGGIWLLAFHSPVWHRGERAAVGRPPQVDAPTPRPEPRG
jgi:septal ring factor EnvC (AmiA/AmiB activator)